jgi:hypothetical protein
MRSETVSCCLADVLVDVFALGEVDEGLSIESVQRPDP